MSIPERRCATCDRLGRESCPGAEHCMSDPDIPLHHYVTNKAARHAADQARYKAKKDAQAAQNAEAVRILFLIIKRLVKSPQADINEEDAKLLNEIEQRLKLRSESDG